MKDPLNLLMARIVATIFFGLLVLYVVSTAAQWMTTDSDAAVVAGTVAVIASGVSAVWLARKVWFD